MKKNKKFKGPNAQKKAAEKQTKRAGFFTKLLIVTAVILSAYWGYTKISPKVLYDVTNKIKSKIAINGCVVKGAEGLDSVKIAECLMFDKNANIFNSNKEIKNKIAKIDGVESVKIVTNPFSQIVDVKITKRTAKYRVNIDNKLFWADKNGYLWQEKNTDAKLCLVVGVKAEEDSIGKKIEKNDFERLSNTIEKIKGTGKNSDNITMVNLMEKNVTEFWAKNISVPVRLFGTLKYGSDDFEYFESVLRKKNRIPLEYFDAYENCIYSL